MWTVSSHNLCISRREWIVLSIYRASTSTLQSMNLRQIIIGDAGRKVMKSPPHVRVEGGSKRHDKFVSIWIAGRVHWGMTTGIDYTSYWRHQTKTLIQRPLTHRRQTAKTWSFCMEAAYSTLYVKRRKLSSLECISFSVANEYAVLKFEISLLFFNISYQNNRNQCKTITYNLK